MNEMKTLTINGVTYYLEGHSPCLSESGTWMIYDPEENKYIDTGIKAEGNDYILTDKDKADIAKLNTLIVTPPGDGDISSNPASHTPAEILAHVQSGGIAVLLDGDTYAYLSYCDEEEALFTGVDDAAKTRSYAIRSSNMIAYSKIEYNIRDMINCKITAPTTAQVGQTIVVKSVDTDGRPLSWGAVDLPLMVNFETEDFASLTSTDYTAAEMISAVQNGRPVIGTIVNRDEQSGMTVLVQWDGSRVQVGCPVGDGTWQHFPNRENYYEDGDTSNKAVGNERWIEY